MVKVRPSQLLFGHFLPSRNGLTGGHRLNTYNVMIHTRIRCVKISIPCGPDILALLPSTSPERGRSTDLVPSSSSKVYLIKTQLLGLCITRILWVRQWSATQIPRSYSPSHAMLYPLTSHCLGLSRSSPSDVHIRTTLFVAVNGRSSRRLKDIGEHTVRSGQALRYSLPTTTSSHGTPQSSRPGGDLERHIIVAFLRVHLSCP